MGVKRDVEEYLQLNDLSPEEASTGSVAGRLGAHPAKVDKVLDDLATDAPLSGKDIRDHYRRVRDVYNDITVLNGKQNARTAGVIDNRRWYTYRTNIDDFDALEEGYNHFGSAKPLPDAANEIATHSGRVLYALTTYSPVIGQEEPCRFTHDSEGNRSNEFRDDGPLPDYKDIVGQALFADVDLAGEYKKRPLPDDIREITEAALEVYVDHFAELTGSRDHVLLLDSVGGAYPMIPATATVPLAEEFTASDDRKLVYEELCSRMNEWLTGVWGEVQDIVPAAAEYLDPDHINNKNRQYKTVMSIHKSIDGVVTPIDVEGIRYDYVPVEDITDTDITAARKWAESLTADRHRKAVDSIIETLWPDYHANAETWIQALEKWLLDHERERLQKKQRRKRRMDSIESGEVVELKTADVTLTTDQSDVRTTLDNLDPERVIEKTILGVGWTDSVQDADQDRSGDGKRAFIPSWTTTYDSGNATYVGVKGSKSGVWYDSSKGYKGGPVEAALIAHSSRSEADGFAGGENWREGVDILRRLGFDIPVWIPDASSLDSDQIPLWALRKFALKLDIVEQHELVERTGDDGSSYLGFCSSDYRRVVRRAEAVGLDTGRLDHLTDAPTSEYYNVDLQAYTVTEQSPYANPDVMLAACLRAHDDEAVPENTDPPTIALIPIVREAGLRENPEDMSPGTRAMAVDVFIDDLDVTDVREDDTVEIFSSENAV